MPKKKNSNYTGDKKKQKRASERRPLIIPYVIVGLVVCLCAAAIGYILWQGKLTRQRDTAKVEAQKEPLDICVADVKATLQTVSGTAKVYDVKGNVIFTITDSNGAVGMAKMPDSLLTLMRDRIAGGEVRKIDLDAWSESHTIIGSLTSNSPDNADFTKGSLGWQAVNYWCAVSKTMLSEDAKLIIGAGLDQQFTDVELTRYCLANANFGTVQGITRAADIWFGKPISDLNSNQQAYLMYALENVDANFTAFSESNPTKTGGALTAEEFGLASAGDPYWLLRKMTYDELVEIVGNDLVNTSYNVKLRIDPQVQSAMQSAIDNTMQSSISLGSNGQTVLDATAVCIDSHTGFITGLIGGRSVNSIASALTFQTTNAMGNYEKAREMLEADANLTVNSLISYETLSGTTECAAFNSLVAQGQLGVTGNTPVLESSITLNGLMEFITDLYVDTGARLIEQITTENGKNVYTAAAANDISQKGVNPDLRVLFNGDPTATGFDYVQYTTSGVVLGTATSEVIVCGLYGTGSLGYSLSDSDYNMCVSTAIGVLDGATAYYPKDPSSIDPAGTVAAKVAKAQEDNAEFVKEIFEAWLTELTEMPINSSETLSNFEQTYSYYGNLFNQYVGVVSEELLQEYADKFEQIRTDRSDELLQYAS